jgi:replicative DNA helicase
MSATNVCCDTPADYLLNGIIKLLADGRSAEARVAVAKADEDLFENAVDRDLFRAIRRAVDFSSAPGPLEVQFLIEHDEDVGAPAEDVLARLWRGREVAASIGWEHHIDSSIRFLEAQRAARQARELGRELAAAGSSPTPERCEEVIRMARSIQDGIGSGGPAGAQGLLSVIDQWKRRDAEKIVVTGFRPFDRRFGGGLPVGLHGIAAAPGIGKSALALQLAAGVLLHDRYARVVWLRGEMSNDLLFSRLLACWSRLRDPAVDPVEVGAALRRDQAAVPVYKDIAEIVGDRLLVVDPPITPSSIERWTEEARPSMVVLDYIQEVEAAGFKDKRTEIEHVVQRLARLSIRHEIPVVVVSSVAGSTTADSSIGRLTKESNRLDYAAHTFTTLWPDGAEDDCTKRITMQVQKNRTGAKGTEELWLHGPTQYFTPAAAEIHEEFSRWPAR